MVNKLQVRLAELSPELLPGFRFLEFHLPYLLQIQVELVAVHPVEPPVMFMAKPYFQAILFRFLPVPPLEDVMFFKPVGVMAV